MRNQLVLFLLLIFTWGCSIFESDPKSTDVHLVGAKWVLHSLNGESVPNLPQSIYLEFTEEKRKRFIGFSGCNEIFGVYSLNPNTILFEEMGSTRKTCHYQQIENEFVEMLKISTHFKIRGHQLSFYESHRLIATMKSI